MGNSISYLSYQAKTVYLFTRSDYKTIFFPVTLFAIAVSSVLQPHAILRTVIWTWLHLLQANVSNQTFSGHEDQISKPWRPLPSGRVTVYQARILRYYLAVICLAFSWLSGPTIGLTSMALTIVEILHDDLLLSGKPILKNLCNVGGYLTFEIGATLLMTPAQKLDIIAYRALTCSALVIFTTISAQDFADVEGDKLSNRRTIPIIAPVASRWYILMAIIAWSLILPLIWRLGPICSALFLGCGLFVGIRYFRLRTMNDDKLSYLFYNVWLAVVHILPLNARMRILSR